MKKIGILGGTFNPIHNAHLMMAQAAYEQYQLDEVWFMPSKNPPHKRKENIVSEQHRSRMIQFAIDGAKQFSFSCLELEREGITYTYETLAQCVEKYPDTKFYFIVGGDSLRDFEQWYRPETIVSFCTVLATSRNGMSEEELKRRCEQLSAKLGGVFLPVMMPQIAISSMEIRQLLADGKALNGIVPNKVSRYIQFHGLYQEEPIKKIERKEWNSYLASTLRPKRYEHTIGVANTAMQLAAVHIGTKEACKRAKWAGLLHDCAKYLTDAEMLIYCKEYDISLSTVEMQNPALIHGKLGAYFAKHRYGVTDEEICSAICCHTTGKPNMTTLEKILYVADFIEPGRKMDSMPYSLMEVRKMCFCDLDKGLRMTLANTVHYLQKGNYPIDDTTLQTYDYYNATENR